MSSQQILPKEQDTLKKVLSVSWFVFAGLTLFGFVSATYVTNVEYGSVPAWLWAVSQSDRPLQAARHMLLFGAGSGILMTLNAAWSAWLHELPAWMRAHLALVLVYVAIIVIAFMTPT